MLPSTPTVTIIVPAYRRLTYLREAVASASAQTYIDFELIVSDDSASEEIEAYVASLKDPRLRYRKNERNLGIALNNLAAFAEARGRFIASLHDDDTWEPDFLATLVPILEADPELTVVFCDHHLMDGDGRLLPEQTEANSRLFGRHRLTPGRHQPFIRETVLDLAIPMVMAAVFRKSILDQAPFPKRVGGSYDHWLAYLAVMNGQPCYYVPRRLTRYRVHNGSGTAKGGVRNYRDTIYVRRRFVADSRLLPYRRELCHGLGVIYGKMALQFLGRRSYKRGRVFLWTAFGLMNRFKSRAALAANVAKVFLRPKAL